jgi:spore germination protein KC
MKRRIVSLIIITALTLSFAGCSFPEAFPIEKEQHIMIAGVDVDGEDIDLTVLVDSVSAGGESGKEQIKYKLFESKGATIYDADSHLHQMMEKRPSWFHTKYILVGEEAAKSGTNRLFSFFMEDDETRMLYRIALVKGMTAKEFLQKANTGKEDLADYLDSLFSALDQSGKSREVHLINYASQIEIPWVSNYMPVLELQKNPMKSEGSGGGDSGGGGSDSGSSEQKNLVVLNGFALFDEDILAGFMGGDIARGLNVITNDAKSSEASVKDRYGRNVGLELMKSSAKIKPSFEPLSAEIEVNIEATLVEYLKSDPLSEGDIKYLEQQLSEHILGEVAQAITLLQQFKSDPARIMDAFYHKDPVKFQSIAADWKNVFSSLPIKVKVSSKILHTYELTEAIGDEDGG